jgi:1,4-dihydroxy-2-naphthoate octaprenyltransferase
VWVAVTALAMLVLAWEYSAPPLRLCASGAGELDTAIVVTGLVPWLGFHLQAPDLTGAHMLVLALVPCALLQIAMLLAIEFPDAEGDAATGKRTLVVRLARGGRHIYMRCHSAAYVWPTRRPARTCPRRAAAALPAPIAVWRIARLGDHRDPAAFERMTFFAVFLLVATSTALLAAFIL